MSSLTMHLQKVIAGMLSALTSKCGYHFSGLLLFLCKAAGETGT